MSADNWAVCPKCSRKHSDDREAAFAKLEKQYGKIPSGEFTEKFRDLQAIPEEFDKNTLREDYEIGIIGSYFEVNFRASCHICSFAFTKKEQQPLDLK